MKAAREFVEANRDRLERHFLPPYSPQPNPDEQVWNHLKNHTLGKRGFRLAERMLGMVHDRMEWLRGSEMQIRAFFGEPGYRYAKA